MPTEAKASQPLSRRKVREVLKRHKGSIAALAADLQVRPESVTIVLQGRSKSARILEAARRLALELEPEAA